MVERVARLGFPVQVIGRPYLKSHDARRAKSRPHLSVSLGYLERIFKYLDHNGIRMYRMASGLAPYATHPDLPAFHHQIDACERELQRLGTQARTLDLRLSFHPGQFVVLNTPDDDLAARSAHDIEVQASLLNAMELDGNAVVVIHIGGVYQDRSAAIDRFARRFERLSPNAKARLAVENDDARFDVLDALDLHAKTGVPVIFDVHHHRCHNPKGLTTLEAVKASLKTWDAVAAHPKIHFSSPRTDWGFRYGSDEGAVKPRWNAHAEFADPYSFIELYRLLGPYYPDVMLEAKAKDVAVLQLREDLLRHAPDVAKRFGWIAPALEATE